MRNGLIDGIKCQSSEQKGNLFQLLCIAHTINRSHVMKRSSRLSDTKWKQYIDFFMQYLGMEEWFHDSNYKLEVINARPQIAKVLLYAKWRDLLNSQSLVYNGDRQAPPDLLNLLPEGADLDPDTWLMRHTSIPAFPRR
jgi:hypothetical protein